MINLPWASFRRPSIQIGLLGELARLDGHNVELAHLNLELAVELGKALYDQVSEHRSTALGDWLFARAAFPATAPGWRYYLDAYGDVVQKLLTHTDSIVSPHELIAFRESRAERFLVEQIEAHDWSRAQVFGLSSTFQQNTACFAMARLLKQKFPDCTIVAGGANFDGEMGEEWLRAVDAIDMVVSGEGDIAFRRLLTALRLDQSLETVPNLILRKADGVWRTPASEPFRDLDTLPMPDYHEYFVRAERIGLLTPGPRVDVDIPIETSRGCWWGERRHCTFCGLNGATMTYRAKSPERALNEFATLSRRHRSFRFFVVDNIADMKFHKTMFPALAERHTSYNIFYEVKSGLPPDRLKELRAAGAVRIQPGIESLSTRVLSLMSKGVSAIANVNLLRWCIILDIDVSWNLIWGFPGERDEDYVEQAALIPHLFHLPPPLSGSRIWLERFSPLFRRRTEQQRPLMPEASLRHVYPDNVDLNRAAYFFEYDFESDVRPETYQHVGALAFAWHRAHSEGDRPTLEYRYSDNFLQIDDRRHLGSDGTFTFEDAFARLYIGMTHSPRTIEQLRAASTLDDRDFDTAIEQFCAQGLAMRDGSHLLALALPHREKGRFG
ncbi:RiPP maturation radical SAM C-methyltransferase [Bradyrhizobium brasilense]|uniref:RiPP maturation radical SAM C-methyltransferase n=1 Tax=Bradyrhizobium brasilense TaxID=1419277 RepID=UPI0015A07E57|nr:RiPP maturation radical SAM C-methyltransferase [Bradyrhizobium brasilense]